MTIRLRLSVAVSCIMCIVPQTHWEAHVNYSLLRKQLKVWQEISPSPGVTEKTEVAGWVRRLLEF